MFIAFEGIDGSGKSTISSLLRKYLEDRGWNVVLTHEPQDLSLRHPSHEDAMNGFLMFYKFMADRVSHMSSMEKSLGDGKVVISDRYLLSTLAYQGPLMESFFGDYQRTVQWMMDASRPVKLMPDVTFLMDASPAVTLGRIREKKKDAFEKEEYLTRVREYYLRCKWPNKVVIEATRNLEECFAVVTGTIDALMA